MRLRYHLAVILLAVSLSGPVIAQTIDFDRGLRNYKAVLNGGKQLDDLSEAEKQEVFAVARIMQSRTSDSGSEECVEAQERAGAAAAELANYARRLRNCAESNNFSDDCSTEFSRVRNAHSEYESAVAEVGSYCD
jgi:hypothetical protein